MQSHPYLKDIAHSCVFMLLPAAMQVAEMQSHPWLTGASLPEVGEEQESHQTELDIHDIVERARRCDPVSSLAWSGAC